MPVSWQRRSRNSPGRECLRRGRSKKHRGECPLPLTRLVSFPKNANSSCTYAQLRRGLHHCRRRVALSSSHVQPDMAGRDDLHFDSSKSAGALDVQRRIADRVLLAKIVCDFCCYVCDGLAFAGKVGDSPRIFAEPPEKAWIFFLYIRTD